MEENDKLPLKRVEVSLTKFNEVAIPHHLDLLRQHRANIIKYSDAGDSRRVRAEQLRACRVTSQLRALLAELSALRLRVATTDHPRFDKLTLRARDDTLRAILDYLETSPLSINRGSGGTGSDEDDLPPVGSALSTDSVGVVAHAQRHADTLAAPAPAQLQLQVDEQELELRTREDILEGWTELQHEVHALHEAWRQVHCAAVTQADAVKSTAASVEVAADNVQVARTDLASAERIRASLYGCGGAVAGALAGGPVGLVLGAKLGAAALVAGSALGYWAARALGRRRADQLDQADQGNTEQDKRKDD